MSSTRQIAEGVWNDLRLKSLPQEDQDIILGRRAICATCPYNSRNRTDDASPFLEECTLCGCVIRWKTASLSSSCGAEEWNADEENVDNHKPVMWHEKGKD